MQDCDNDSIRSSGSTDRICTAALKCLNDKKKVNWDQDDHSMIQLFLHFRRKVKQLTGEHKGHKKLKLEYDDLLKENQAQRMRILELENLIGQEEPVRKKIKSEPTAEEPATTPMGEPRGGVGTALYHRICQQSRERNVDTRDTSTQKHSNKNKWVFK